MRLTSYVSRGVYRDFLYSLLTEALNNLEVFYELGPKHFSSMRECVRFHIHCLALAESRLLQEENVASYRFQRLLECINCFIYLQVPHCRGQTQLLNSLLVISRPKVLQSTAVKIMILNQIIISMVICTLENKTQVLTNFRLGLASIPGRPGIEASFSLALSLASSSSVSNSTAYTL